VTTIPVLLLLALPASGKSEIRRYLEHPDPALPRLPLGPTIQLDDYPYVHLMRRISQEQRHRAVTPTFFASDESSLTDARDWLTLIHLVNDDHASLGTAVAHDPSPAALVDRLDSARHRAGIAAPAVPDRRDEILASIAAEASDLAGSLPIARPAELEAATVIVEFARGGPEGATPPLPAPLGYAPSLAALSPAILSRAAILYVWVTPEESRRRNAARAIPGAAGDASILHHGVPEHVMRHDYGMDDMEWLAATSTVAGAITVGGTTAVPFERLDNRVDRTSFLRDDPETWPADKVKAIHVDLAAALDRLAGTPPRRG
jgi:hypothetical protein